MEQRAKYALSIQRGSVNNSGRGGTYLRSVQTHSTVPWYTDVERYCVSDPWNTDVIQNPGTVTRYSILVC